MSDITRKITRNVDAKIVVSVVVGLAAFGAALYFIKKLPANAITNPVKKAAEAVAG